MFSNELPAAHPLCHRRVSGDEETADAVDEHDIPLLRDVDFEISTLAIAISTTPAALPGPDEPAHAALGKNPRVCRVVENSRGW
jgi:hypothetical protein